MIYTASEGYQYRKMSFIAQCLVMFALFGCSSLLRRKSVLEMFPEYMDFKAEIRENINALKGEKKFQNITTIFDTNIVFAT